MGKLEGIGLGHISTNAQGRVCISSTVMGVDLKELSDSYAEIKKAQSKPVQDQIDKATKQIAAFQEAESKLSNLRLKTGVLANRTKISSENAPCVFQRKTVTAFTSNGSEASSIALVTPSSTANLGTFTLRVDQLAKNDMLKGTINIPSSTAALNIPAGNLEIGTILPNSLQTVHLEQNMSLLDIKNTINSVSDKTGVSAEISLVSPGIYELKLKASNSGVPIVLKDTNNVKNALNLSTPPSNSICGCLSAETSEVALALEGTLTVGTTQENSRIINVTADMTLTQIRNAINAEANTTTVDADFEITHDTVPAVYQLRLKARNVGNTILLSDTNNMKQSLGLNNPTTDYNQLVSKFVCDDTSYKRKQNAILDVVQGSILDLRQASPATITASITHDKSKSFEALSSFIQAFNEFNDFYMMQNQRIGEKQLPTETAILYQNQTLRQSFQSIKTILSNSIPGLENNTLSSIGLGFDNDYQLIMKNEEQLNKIFEDHYSDLQKLLANTSNTSNPLFQVYALPDALSAALSNIPITVTHEKSADGAIKTAKFTINGIDYEADITKNLIKGKEGSLLEGISVLCSKELENGETQTTTLTLTQGFAARIDNALKNILIGQPEKSQKGLIPLEIDLLSKKNTLNSEKIEKINKDAQREADRYYKEFDKIHAASQQLESITSMVKSFRSSGRI